MFACHESQLVDFELPRRGGGSLLSDERAVLGVWEEPQLEVTSSARISALPLVSFNFLKEPQTQAK